MDACRTADSTTPLWVGHVRHVTHHLIWDASPERRWCEVIHGKCGDSAVNGREAYLMHGGTWAYGTVVHVATTRLPWIVAGRSASAVLSHCCVVDRELHS